MSMLRSVQVLLAVFISVIALDAGAASEKLATRTSFDIPAQSLGISLKQLANQAGIQILFEEQLVRGLNAPAIKAEQSPLQVLERLLKNTGLEFTARDETVAVRKKGAVAASAKTAAADASQMELRLVQNAQAAQVTAERDKQAESGEMEVVDSRIDGLNNAGLLQTGAEAPLYHNVITREDIERLGVTNMEELFRFIPQTTSAETYAQGAAGSQLQGQERTPTISLRGFSSSQTVVLVNGRALPRTSPTSGGGADINRIPLAAIDRIEIMPYAGSAIYGAGAIGGVVNVILRKDYAGQDLTAYVGVSQGGGAGERRLTYIDGRNFNDGNTRLTLSLNLQQREELRLGDRDYLDRAIATYGPDSTARVGAGGTGALVFESQILPALAQAPATIVLSATTGDLGIPGRPGVRYATVPVGTSPAQSLTLTPGSFVSTAGNYSTGPSRYDRLILSEPRDNYSLNAQLEHTLIPRRLEAYGEFTVSLNQTRHSAPEAAFSSFSLTAADPLNPFGNSRTDGLPGRAVTVHFDTPDIPDATFDRETQSGRAVVGLKGAINDKWDWSADGVIDYTDSDTTVIFRATGTSGVTGLIALSPFDNPAIPGSPASATVRRAIYPLLADHEVYPITPATADAYFGGGRRTPTKALQKEGNVRLTGDVYSLPAGPLRTSIVGKLRHFDRHSSFYTLFTPDYYLLLNGSASATGPVEQSPIDSKRKTLQGAVELAVPIFGRSWQPVPFMQGLDLNLSYSTEKNSTDGVNQSSGLPFEFDGDAARTYVAALKWQIVPDIALRASFTEGFYPPDWNDLSDRLSPQTIPATTLSALNAVDPRRGNRALALDYPSGLTNYNGGNPVTLPESAKSSNIGLILKPRFAPGLTMMVDLWSTKKTGAIVRTNFVQVLSQIGDYEGSIVRAAPTPTDTANGWAGLITEFYTGPINIAILETEGADINIHYDHDAGEWGNFLFTTNASFTNHFQTQALPGARLVETASAGGPNRWRGYASAGWERAGLGASLTGRYVGKYSTSTTAPTRAFPSASGLDGPYIPAVTIYDLQLSYAVRGGRGGMLQGLLDGSQWTVGINNVFDKTPDMVTDGQAFYNRQVDPRQRFGYLQYRKNF